MVKSPTASDNRGIIEYSKHRGNVDKRIDKACNGRGRIDSEITSSNEYEGPWAVPFLLMAGGSHSPSKTIIKFHCY